MGFGGAKQQVPSPWGEKQFKPKTHLQGFLVILEDQNGPP